MIRKYNSSTGTFISIADNRDDVIDGTGKAGKCDMFIGNS